LQNPDDEIFFDAASTQLRPRLLKQAIRAGKHVYCEKPVATTLAEASDLYRAAKKARIKHGVVQDKLWLPGLAEAREASRRGFFGKILSVRGEFGYWVFEGDPKSAGPPRSGRPGTTGRRTAAGSSSTCSATGGTCSTTCSAR
jgi:predicted dehydrogenase